MRAREARTAEGMGMRVLHLAMRRIEGEVMLSARLQCGRDAMQGAWQLCRSIIDLAVVQGGV